MKNYLIFILSITLFGCASQGVNITKNNNNIEKPLYSISIPPDQGWHMRRDENDPKAALLCEEFRFSVLLFNALLDEQDYLIKAAKTLTAEQIADDYRNGEKQGMIIQWCHYWSIRA